MHAASPSGWVACRGCRGIATSADILVLPREFPPPTDRLLASDSTGFPLGYLLTEVERARINGIYKEFMRAGAVFDERMSLRDIGGVARAVRVICVTRAADRQCGGARGWHHRRGEERA